ncbi:MAG: hypothetical protein KGH63_01070 [Candidatus Micrarchaeota archaeon]|nr:hypothetical protein [Candidatus Micrarchaeota archaeon]
MEDVPKSDPYETLQKYQSGIPNSELRQLYMTEAFLLTRFQDFAERDASFKPLYASLSHRFEAELSLEKSASEESNKKKIESQRALSLTLSQISIVLAQAIDFIRELKFWE